MKSQLTIRRRVLYFIGVLICLSVMGSAFSLFRISRVNRSLDSINRISIPMSKVLLQMQVDAEVYKREMNRSLGFNHWKEENWFPKSAPLWITDVLDHEYDRALVLSTSLEQALGQDTNWIQTSKKNYELIKKLSHELQELLESKNTELATKKYPQWIEQIEEWTKQLQWGAVEFDRFQKEKFNQAQMQVEGLRTGLEIVLVVVIALSGLLIWLGEKALSPLSRLTLLAREIRERGVRREDKAVLSELTYRREDEVSELAREFHQMATALLEREKIVSEQSKDLEDHNILLNELVKLNDTILNSFPSLVVITDLNGKITRVNSKVTQVLQLEESQFLHQNLSTFPMLQSLRPSEKLQWEGKTYYVTQTHLSENALVMGVVWQLTDLTEDLKLQERLKHAETLATLGRLSAQVAHEIRNPLHSIGLEAEMATDIIQNSNAQSLWESKTQLKSSLQSIQFSVERLDQITENYLKLSKLSQGVSNDYKLSQVIECVLATYANQIEKSKIKLEWKYPKHEPYVRGDASLMEQAIGNLVRNSLQALEEVSGLKELQLQILALENSTVCFRVSDNGPGISSSLLPKLFSPFLTTKAQGTGLGLSFVKKVIEDHKGSVNYLEQVRGACFEVKLPSIEDAQLHSSSFNSASNSYSNRSGEHSLEDLQT